MVTAMMSPPLAQEEDNSHHSTRKQTPLAANGSGEGKGARKSSRHHENSSPIGGTAATAMTTMSPATETDANAAHRKQSSQQHQQNDSDSHEIRGGEHPTTNRSTNDEDDFLVACRCESAQSFVTLLHCLKDVGTRGLEGAPTQSSQLNSQASSSRRQSQRKLQPVTVFCSPNGLTFQVYGSAKQSQASIDVPAAFFSTYRVSQQTDQSQDGSTTESGSDGGTSREFCVNLSTLLECLAVVVGGTTNTGRGGGSSARGSAQNNTSASSEYSNNVNNNKSSSSAPPLSLTMTYHLSTELLKVELEESGAMVGGAGMLCTAAIPGMLPPDDDDDDDGKYGGGMAGAFLSSPVQARILLPSGHLALILPELEHVAGATVAQLGISSSDSQQQHGDTNTTLELGVVGHAGQCWLSLHHGTRRGINIATASTTGSSRSSRRRRGQRGALETANNNVRWHSYPLNRLLQSMKALDIANETCLSINQDGIMAIQHQIFLQDAPPDTPVFCDFVLVSLWGEEDDDMDTSQEDQTARGDDEDESATLSTNSSRRNLSISSQPPHLSPSQSSSRNSYSRRKRQGQLSREGHRNRRPRTSSGRSQSDSGNSDGDDQNQHRPMEHEEEEERDHDESDDEEEDVTRSHSSSVAPLFGTVVSERHSMSPQEVAEERRRQGRLRRRLSRHQSRSKKVVPPMGDESVDSNRPNDSSMESSTISSRPQSQSLPQSRQVDNGSQQRRREAADNNNRSHYRHADDYGEEDEFYPSSPELVYGQQD